MADACTGGGGGRLPGPGRATPGVPGAGGHGAGVTTDLGVGGVGGGGGRTNVRFEAENSRRAHTLLDRLPCCLAIPIRS